MESTIKDFLSQNRNANSSSNFANRTEDLSDSFCDSGSVIATGPDNYESMSSYSGTIVFNNCSSIDYGYGYSFLWDGTVYFTYSESGTTATETLAFDNFTVQYTYNGQTETLTLNYSETCTFHADTYDYYGCTTYSDFDGYDGRTYRVSEVTVDGDNTSGYDIDATVYDPDYGYFTVVATDVIFCDSGLPGSGSVTYSDGIQTATIEFLSCTEYQYTYDGTTFGPFTW